MQLSVLMSVYGKDNPDHFDQALGSVVDQTKAPGQIVIVADGPLTDALNNVLDDYASQYSDLFTIIRLAKPSGPACAWNQGLEQCSCDLVARMDADDISLPERFERQMAFLQAHPEVDVVGTYYAEFEDDRDMPVALYSPPTGHAAILKYARLRNPLCHPSVMYRKQAVTEHGGYVQVDGFVDYYLWIRMLQAGRVFANLPEVLLKYRGGRHVMSRRGGVGYVRNEWRFLRIAYKSGFISFRLFVCNVVIRPFVRMMPVTVRNLVYRKLLRQPVGNPEKGI